MQPFEVLNLKCQILETITNLELYLIKQFRYIHQQYLLLNAYPWRMP